MATYLITGCAGFIGFHLTRRLLADGLQIVGLDNLNDYYDVTLKLDRLKILEKHQNFTFVRAALEDREAVDKVFQEYPITKVINLAAQAGVRYSLENPRAYIDSNIIGFFNILEGCRNNKIEHLIFASSSSVYGSNTQVPFTVQQNTDHPLSLYAATKKSDELMAHAYSHLYGLPTTGLRFFTVYGPWGRPDMAYFLFTRAILEGEPIKVFNKGNMGRDFTYIDDIVEGVARLVELVPEPNPLWDRKVNVPGGSMAPYRIYNIGNNKPVELNNFIAILERKLGREARKVFMPMEAADVLNTCAEVSELAKDTGFKPDTPIEEGLSRFVDWYMAYYQGQ